MRQQLAKVCGIVYKLRHCAPLSTLKTIYFALFQSKIQYSILNWGRANKTLTAPLQVLQNKFIRACLFLSKSTNINYLFYEFNVLKINDLIKIDHAKFMFKYINNMLPHVLLIILDILGKYTIITLANAKHVNYFYLLFLPTLVKKWF